MFKNVTESEQLRSCTPFSESSANSANPTHSSLEDLSSLDKQSARNEIKKLKENSSKTLKAWQCGPLGSFANTLLERVQTLKNTAPIIGSFVGRPDWFEASSNDSLIGPVEFLDKFRKQELHWAVPRWDDSTMHFELYSSGKEDSEYSQSNKQIVTPDILLIPCLVLDSFGNRMGRGKGHYDRFLPKLNPHTPKIGVIHSTFFMKRLPSTWVEPHDIPLDFALSETGITDLRDTRSNLK